MRKLVLFSSLFTVLLIIAGCSGVEQPAAPEEAPPPPQPLEAVAVLEPTQGSSVQGTVTFQQMEEGIHVSARVTGLTPGKPGFHIHEKGDCSAPDGTSAGGHFNPTGADHAGPESAMQHAGDLGNLEANADGVADYHAMLSYITLEEGSPNYIVGLGVIVHEQEDDLMSQPTGAAGARLACGVIKLR